MRTYVDVRMYVFCLILTIKIGMDRRFTWNSVRVPKVVPRVVKSCTNCPLVGFQDQYDADKRQTLQVFLRACVFGLLKRMTLGTVDERRKMSSCNNSNSY